MAVEGQAPLTAGEYVIHHLTHLHNAVPKGLVDMSVLNFDSIFFSILLGAITCYVLWRAAKRATPGVPGRFQAAVEILFEWIENESKGIVHNAQSRRLVAPLALTVFLWVMALNAMDLLPVDLLPWLALHLFGIHYLRVVPSADLSITMGLSIAVLILSLIYNVKIKGAGGWTRELMTAPFGDKWYLYPVNFAMQIIEFASKTISHGMRLFGNMYAGELIFMLIALMGGALAFTGTGIALFFGAILAGTLWAIFHILIITIQAFIFMMLTLVYIGQAHDTH